MNDFYDERLSVHIGLLMQKALLYEVNTTLKPGLVDRIHNGSHKDMSIGTFVTSAYALTPYFIRCARLGLTFYQDLSKLPELFKQIRKEGQTAELTMLRATGGVNTHKGIVFSGGILCATAGYAVSEYRTVLSCENLPSLFMDICQNMLTELMDDCRNINENTAKSHGERLYAKYGVTGIRGEAAHGFPHLFTSGLPVFENALKKNYSMNQAGQLALLYYIANTEDTNLITRSDYLTAQKIQTELAVFLQNADEARQLKIIPELDAYFVSKNISPGGSADMLALTYFLHFLQTIGCIFD